MRALEDAVWNLAYRARYPELQRLLEASRPLTQVLEDRAGELLGPQWETGQASPCFGFSTVSPPIPTPEPEVVLKPLLQAQN